MSYYFNSSPADWPKVQVNPPAKRQPTQPAKRQPTQPAKRQPTQPAKRQATQPAKRQATQPAIRQSTQPAKMQPTQPAKRQPIPPAKRQPTQPAKRQSTPPTKGQPSPPTKGQQTTHPEKKPTPPRVAPESCDRENMKWNKGQPAPAARKHPKHVKNKENKTKTNSSNKYQQVPPITMVITNQETTNNNKENQQNEIMKHTEAAEKRRKRIRKNKEITIATINVRGLKGKIKSLESLLQTEKIAIALITETMWKKGEKISIKRYRWADKSITNNRGGGVGILVSEKITQNTTEDNTSDEHESLESKWIQIESRPKNLAIGVLYGPQEN